MKSPLLNKALLSSFAIIMYALAGFHTGCASGEAMSSVDDSGSDFSEDEQTDSDIESETENDTESSDAESDSDGAFETDEDYETDPYVDSDTDTKPEEDTDTKSPPDYETWRFAVIGDSRSDIWGANTAALSKLVQALIKADVELVLFTGDSVFGAFLVGAQMPSWLDTMQPLWDAGIKVYPTRGNHEAEGINVNALGVWQNSFVNERELPSNGPKGHDKATYSVTHRNAMFISVDNYLSQGKVPQEWLDVQFAEMEVPHLFVFGHEPAFKLQHEDCLDDFPAKRDDFWQSLRQAGGRTYFCGHDHFYDHARVNDGDGDPDNDIHQYVVGTAGATQRPWSPPYNGNNSGMTIEQISHVTGVGYVLVEIAGPEVTLTWTEIDGDQGDRWSYTVD